MSTVVRQSKGETVQGKSFQTFPGGKEANQAVAAIRHGADVPLIGCVGEENFGKELKAQFSKEGIRLCLGTEANEPTGIASITLSNGDNSMIVIQGANQELTPQMVQSFENVIASSDILLIQLEISNETVEYSAKLACSFKSSSCSISFFRVIRKHHVFNTK